MVYFNLMMVKCSLMMVKCSSMMVEWKYNHTLISPSLTSISPSLTSIIPSLAHLTIIEKLHRLQKRLVQTHLRHQKGVLFFCVLKIKTHKKCLNLWLLQYGLRIGAKHLFNISLTWYAYKNTYWLRYVRNARNVHNSSLADGEVGEVV